MAKGNTSGWVTTVSGKFNVTTRELSSSNPPL